MSTAIATEQIRHIATTSLQALAAAAAPHQGLVPNVLDLAGQALSERPPAITGQRQGDRAVRGCNLLHDIPLLEAWSAAAQAWDLPELAAAGEAYLDTWMAQCTDTPSGLWPWGEHAFWDLITQAPGNSYEQAGRGGGLTHDHLRQAPPWFWDRCWQRSPQRVRAFCHGLDNHFKDTPELEFLRHAAIGHKGRNAMDRTARSCDFPRHTGLYLVDLACVLAREDDAALLAQLHLWLDYWWQRQEPSGLLRIESRTPSANDSQYEMLTVNQTASLAASLLEAANVLDARHPAVATTMRERAAHYLDAVYTAPHDRAGGSYIFDLRRDDPSIVRYYGTWGSRYGRPVGANMALHLLAAHRAGADKRALEDATVLMRPCCTEPLPQESEIMAKDPGLVVQCLLELYLRTDDQTWLGAAQARAGEAIAAYWQPGQPLPRGATGGHHYEGQLMPSILIHALTRLALVLEGHSDDLLPMDATQR
ncbi:MAG: hypothetical protein PF961_21910 [Planctomycetota bacterium]|nr:hypothetical protein [Planctomycetota bacterium]